LSHATPQRRNGKLKGGAGGAGQGAVYAADSGEAVNSGHCGQFKILSVQFIPFSVVIITKVEAHLHGSSCFC